jgi:SAM-dependent methyltransferase
LSIDPSKPNNSCNLPLACPLCGSHATFPLRSHPTAPVIHRWEQDYGADVASYFECVDEIVESSCGDCGIQFFSPSTLAAKPPLYEAIANVADADGQYYRAAKWEYDMALEDLSARNPNGVRCLLEIGCGFGDFLTLAAVRSPGFAAEGLEQNPSAVREAQRRNLNVHYGDIYEMVSTHAGKYDTLCLFQVLEHVPDPGNLICAVCMVLQKGGRLILAVPNAASFLRHAWNILDMPPHHMTRWQPSVMAQLPRLFPLRLLRVCKEPLADYHVSKYTEAYLSSWSQRPGLRALSHPRAKATAAGLIRRSGMQRFLRGHTLYACFERT